ncbi:Metallo-dependent phosphatase-like protein [Blakeslea trispora]|nr:Metallo-dependent phosphatase-like protein [Blakeslea trispora]
MKWVFLLLTLVSIINANLVFSNANDGSLILKRDEVNGAPGQVCSADNYNILDPNWNRTYGVHEPQQISLSLIDDSHAMRVQFSTLNSIDRSILRYWPSKKSNKMIAVQGKDWTFIDGGAAKRKLYLHKMMTRKLKPATVYHYQVGAAVGNQIYWSEEFKFHSASKKEEFSFLATGDVGACNAVAVNHLKELAKTGHYDFITIAGDQAYDMADFDGTKGDEYLNFMQNLFSRVPYLGSVGNHEGAYNFSHYKNRFNHVPYMESNYENPLMYSINYKSLHLVSFSTEIYFKGTDSEIQAAVNWLDADLAKANKHRHQRPWIIFLTHHPIYCSGDNDDCTIKALTIRNGPTNPVTNQTWGGLEDILLKHRVDVYYSGHVHNYERTYPVAHGKRTSTSYHNAPSFFQIIIGNAGQPEGPTEFNPGPYPDWSARRYASYGFSTFHVSPHALNIVHHQANVDGSLGGIVDQITVTK